MSHALTGGVQPRVGRKPGRRRSQPTVWERGQTVWRLLANAFVALPGKCQDWLARARRLCLLKRRRSDLIPAAAHPIAGRRPNPTWPSAVTVHRAAGREAPYFISTIRRTAR